MELINFLTCVVNCCKTDNRGWLCSIPKWLLPDTCLQAQSLAVTVVHAHNLCSIRKMLLMTAPCHKQGSANILNI